MIRGERRSDRRRCHRAVRTVPEGGFLAGALEIVRAERAGRTRDLRQVDAVQTRRVLPEDLQLPFGCQRGVAELLLRLRGDLEGAERLDLVQRRAVPDRIGAPQDVVLAD